MLLERGILHRRAVGTQAKDVSTGEMYVWTIIHICMNPLSLTGAGNVSAISNSAHFILLSQNFTESGVYYVCEVMEVGDGEKRKVNMNVTTHSTKVTGLLPDTTYRVECVAYHSDGVEYCLEANTTVTTRELHHGYMNKMSCTLVDDGVLIFIHFQVQIKYKRSLSKAAWQNPLTMMV